MVAGVTLAGVGVQSSVAFRWLWLPLMARALGSAQMRVEDGRFEFPAGVAITGLQIIGVGKTFEVRAARVDLALDLWGSQSAGRWVVDELAVDDLEIAFNDAGSSASGGPSLDPFALDLRRVHLHGVRLARVTSSGTRMTLGPGTFALLDGVRGAKPRCRLSGPVRIEGSDRAAFEAYIEIDLRGALAAAAPFLAWEGTGKVRLGSVRADDDRDSILELAGELRGQLGRAMPTILRADLRGRQGKQDAGRVTGTLTRLPSPAGASGAEASAQTTATLAFGDVSAKLLNPMLASLGFGRFESGLGNADMRWHSSARRQEFSSRVDVRDLRVHHPAGQLGPFVLHSVQSASWDADARELTLNQFELDLVLGGVSRVRGRLDRPHAVGGSTGGLPPPAATQSGRDSRARIEIVVQSLPLNELAALGIPIPAPLWTGTLTGKARLGVLETEGTSDYALDLTLALPSSREGRLELTGRAGMGTSIDIERMQIQIGSNRKPVLKLIGSGRYSVAASRMEMKGTIESGKLNSLGLWGLLPSKWTRELSVESLHASWQLDVDSAGFVLRADPRLVGLESRVASRSRPWRLGDVALALALQGHRGDPLVIRELRVRAPDLGRDAELRMTGEADLSASPPAFDLDVSWGAVSSARLHDSGLLSGVPWMERLSAGVLEGQVSVDLAKDARIRGTARMDGARIGVGEREVGPLSASAELELRAAGGALSTLVADVSCASQAGPLLRFEARRATDPSGLPTYSMKVGLLDLGHLRSLLDAGVERTGPVLAGDIWASPRGAVTPFTFRLASASPSEDRVRGEGTLSTGSTPTVPRRIEARVALERVTLEPYLELADLVSTPAPGTTPSSAAPRAPSPPRRQRAVLDTEVQIDGEIGELAWRTLVFQQGSFTWTRDRAGHLVVVRPRQALGGTLRGHATLTTSSASRPRLQWELEGDSLDAEQLSRALLKTDGSTLRGSLRVTSAGQLQVGAGPHQAEGRTELLITNGQFGASKMLDFMATQTRISALRRMRFDTLTSELRLAGDILHIVAVDVRSPIAGLAMRGTLDLSGKLELGVLCRVGPKLKEVMSANEYTQIVGGTLDRFLTLPILVSVDGTVRSPTYSVRPTTSSMTANVWEAMSATGKLLRRGTDGIFKDNDTTR